VRASYIPPPSFVMFNGTFNIPLNILHTFLGAMVGAKMVPRLFFLLLSLFSSQVPLKILHK
jgi:hypothetical protein